MERTVHVPLEGRAYDVVIGPGLLHDVGRRDCAFPQTSPRGGIDR